MLALCYLAFATDTTRVITFEWSREAGGYGGSGENHHELSHHDGNPAKLAKLAEIDRFHLGRLERFMRLLKETREQESQMLDRTMILFGSGMYSGMATGDHSPKNLPPLVAGGRALGFKHGKQPRLRSRQASAALQCPLRDLRWNNPSIRYCFCCNGQKPLV